MSSRIAAHGWIDAGEEARCRWCDARLGSSAGLAPCDSAPPLSQAPSSLARSAPTTTEQEQRP